jgi:hypothetical protein
MRLFIFGHWNSTGKATDYFRKKALAILVLARNKAWHALGKVVAGKGWLGTDEHIITHYQPSFHDE